jgi:RNA polymerase sigma factor (sigma-70 family)
MPEMDDITLLREYAETGSEAAFTALVERYVNLVYSTALRSVGNPHAAEEITQAVFIILAKKAPGLSQRTVLSGWLYQTTRLTAANFLRTEIRRQHREQEAYMQSLLNEPEPEIWPQIAPLLDAAMGRLGESDRNAIVLRFFENKNLREVGLALGTSEDAAKMRVSRTLEKLRKFFAKRGVAFSAAVIAGAVSTNSIQAAPVGLAKSITAVAIAKGAAAGGSTLTLVKGALKLLAWAKAKTAIVVGTTMVLAAGTTMVVVETIQTQNESIDAKIARLSKPGTTVREAVRVLGQPEKYASGTQTIDRDNLPESYQLVYSQGIQVWIRRGKVKELESLQPGPGFSYHGKLRLGSTLDEVLREVGPPSETISGQSAKSVLGESPGGYAGVLYKDLDGLKGYSYYWRPDQNVRFIFRNNIVTALLLDVPD